MTGVRNGPLARMILTSAGYTTIGTVPQGETWLIKTIHYLNAGSAKATVYSQLQAADGPVAARLDQYELEPLTWQTWQGWTALRPGDQLLVSTDQADVHVWVNGAALPGNLGGPTVEHFR